MNIPQNEDKRYQIDAETIKVLPSKNALNSSPPFSNTQSTPINAGRPPDRQRIRFMPARIPKEHVEDGESWGRLGNALFQAGYVNEYREGVAREQEQKARYRGGPRQCDE